MKILVCSLLILFKKLILLIQKLVVTIHKIINNDEENIKGQVNAIENIADVKCCNIDVTWNDSSGESQGVVKLGKLREKFTEISGFTIDKKQVLEELSRDNGVNNKLKNEKNRNELTLVAKLNSKASKEEKEKVEIEMVKIIKKYRHLLHYILVLKENNNFCIQNSAVLYDVDLSKYGKDELTNPEILEKKVERENSNIYWDIRTPLNETDVKDVRTNKKKPKALKQCNNVDLDEEFVF